MTLNYKWDSKTPKRFHCERVCLAFRWDVDILVLFVITWVPRIRVRCYRFSASITAKYLFYSLFLALGSVHVAMIKHNAYIINVTVNTQCEEKKWRRDPRRVYAFSSYKLSTLTMCICGGNMSGSFVCSLIVKILRLFAVFPPLKSKHLSGSIAQCFVWRNWKSPTKNLFNCCLVLALPRAIQTHNLGRSV